jgi:hypothetical protein
MKVIGGSQLVVRDGPLTQPLADYLNHKDSSAEYSGSVFRVKNALQTIPQAERMTFHDAGAHYSRVEAMKVAKEQACVREKAATMMSKGQTFEPRDLHARYEKTLDMKLGKNRSPEKTSFMSQAPSPVVSSPIAAGSPVGRSPTALGGYLSPGGGQRLGFGMSAATSPAMRRT